MKRSIAAALGIALSLSLAPAAGAATADRADRPARDTREMDLRCRDVSPRLDGPAVACGWSAVAADGYRLFRADRDDGRDGIFRTDDPRDRRHVDRTVRAGSSHVYVVQAIGRDGDVVAQSDPVRVTVAGRDHRRQPDRNHRR